LPQIPAKIAVHWLVLLIYLKQIDTNLGFVLQFLEIGIVSTIEANHKPVQTARKGQEVLIKILPLSGQAPKMLGRHFEIRDLLVSKVRFLVFQRCVWIIVTIACCR
jgi:hypothetical protein